jgi:hypothetical protein
MTGGDGEQLNIKGHSFFTTVHDDLTSTSLPRKCAVPRNEPSV